MALSVVMEIRPQRGQTPLDNGKYLIRPRRWSHKFS